MGEPQTDYAYSLKQAAAFCGVSLRTIRRLIESGKLNSVKASTRRRIIRRSELERHLSVGA